MFYKSVILNILCSKQPCKLTILSCDDKLIKEYNIQSYHSKICIRTKGNSIKLFAKYKNQTIYQTVCLHNKFCQSAFASFAFFTILSQKQIVFITLSDKTYGFPIANAILNFNLNSLPLIS